MSQLATGWSVRMRLIRQYQEKPTSQAESWRYSLEISDWMGYINNSSLALPTQVATFQFGGASACIFRRCLFRPTPCLIGPATGRSNHHHALSPWSDFHPHGFSLARCEQQSATLGTK